MSGVAKAGNFDVLSIVEAAYRVELSDQLWLEGLASAARPALDEGFGLSVFEFHFRMGSHPQILQSWTLGVPEDFAKLHPVIFASMGADVQQLPFLHGPCTSGSQMMGLRGDFANNSLMQQYAQKFGVYDSIWITAAEPTGWGCGLHSGRAQIRWASPSTRQRWARVATHLSAAVRLRRRERDFGERDQEQPGRAEAVLHPDGRVAHAEGPAREADAIAHLRQAVLTVERARGQRRSDLGSLNEWQGLVDARWTLVDRFESDGRRYVVARENEPNPPGPAALTLRERQIVGYAALGHDNKVIAYDLGIVHATVRVLLSRAATKLGVKSRSALICQYRELCSCDQVDGSAGPPSG